MPEPIRSTIPQLFVKVNGSPLPQDAFDAILEGVVECSLHLPDACTIRVHDNDFKWLDSDHWKEGNEIRVEAGQGRDPLIKVFEGEITAVEMDLAGMGVATMTVRCMDKAHRLHRGKKRRTWQNRTDSDVVQDIANEMGMRSRITSTPEVHDWVIQSNQSNWEFLQGLAQRNGYRLFLEEKDRLVFDKVQDPNSQATILEWGHELRSFRIRVNSGNQVDSVTVRGWDPKSKKEIIGKASRPQGASTIGMRSSGAATAKAAFGSAEGVVVDRPIANPRQANEIAQSVLDDIGTSFIEADGLCYNHPELKAGDTIKLENIGKRFNGSYVLTSVQHTFSAAEGFSTQFVISGKQPATLLSILGGGGGGGGGGGSSSSGGVGSSHASKNAGGIVIGIVTDNNDPEDSGRVKLKFPWLDDSLTSHWARIATPMAGRNRGFQFLPEVDDEVLVAFEHGDMTRPYVIGALWNGVDRPPLTTQHALGSGGVRRRRIKSRIGHTIDLDDDGRILITSSSGEEVILQNGKGVRISTPTGQKFFASDDGRIGISTQRGKQFVLSDMDNAILLTDEANNSISVSSLPGAIVGVAQIAINLTSGGAIEILGGAAVSVTAGATLSITAPMVNINSGGGGTGGQAFRASSSDPTDSDKAP